jgi:hypothetical protein
VALHVTVIVLAGGGIELHAPLADIGDGMQAGPDASSGGGEVASLSSSPGAIASSPPELPLEVPPELLPVLPPELLELVELPELPELLLPPPSPACGP